MPAAIAASAILDRVRVLLNDVGAAIFTNTVLLPYLDKAYDEAQEIMEDNDIPTQNERTATLSVPANTTLLNYTSTPPLPTDFLYPVRLWERNSGSSDLWTPMDPTRWEPNRQRESYLLDWTWREEEIKLIGATQARDLRIDYKKVLTAITTTAITIPAHRLKTFLESRTALLASFMIGENETRSATLQQDAELAMERIISVGVKNRQAVPVRRLPFRVGRSRR